MAVTEQQFIEQYSKLNADMQQKAYDAWNSQVRGWIDNYNASQNTSTQTQQTPNTQNDTPNIQQQSSTNNSNYQYWYWKPPKEWALEPWTYAYYNDDSDNRRNEIVDNLNNYWQSTPQLFNNYDSFKKNFSYNARSDQQKKTLDDWRYGYDTSRQLSTKSIWDLTTLYGSGQLTDADLNNLRTFYPDKYNQVMNKINAQNDMNQYSEMLYWPEDTLDTSNVFNQLGNQFLNNLLNSSYSSNIDYFEQYQNELNSEEMRGWSDRLTDLDTEIKKIDTDLNSLYKDIEKRYEGTGASTAKIQAVYADEAYDLQIQRNSLALEQQSLATKYNSRLQEAQQNFSMRVQQHQLEMQEKNQYMSELWFAMNLINFETNEEADERAFKNWTRQMDYQYWNINSMDETARRKAVDNSVSEILNKYSDIPMKRSKDQMVEDVLKLVDSGMSLWEALTQNIITPIQSKPEYISWYNSKLGVNSPVQYQMDANWNLSLVWWTATVPIWTTWNNYQSIDLGNWYSVKVDWNHPITINGQQYRITQLWWETATSWIDFAPAVRWDNQEVQAFVGWKVIRSWEDSNSDIWHWKNKYIEILWDDWYVYRYNHLNDWDTWFASWNGKGSVLTWTRVEAGTVIWHMGETGHAYWVHLDLAVYDWSRANSMAVSPLNILDQAKVFFNSVNAQWLWIGSVSDTNVPWGTRDWATLEQKRTYELAVDWLKQTASYWKSDKWKETMQYLKDYILSNPWASADDIIDDYREWKISWVLTSEPVLYNAASSIFTDLYWTNQQKEFNFLEQLENYVDGWDYTSAYEYVLKQLWWATSQSVTNTTKSDIDALRSTIWAMQDISDLYNEFLDNWWRFRDLKEIYQKAVEWAPFVWEGDPQLTEITSRLQLAIANYIAFKSWKTVSEQEYARYASIFPTDLFARSSTKTRNQINSLLNALEDWLNINYRSALWPNQYNKLQDWYKSKAGQYYSFRKALWNYTNYSDDTYELFSEDMLID